AAGTARTSSGQDRMVFAWSRTAPDRSAVRTGPGTAAGPGPRWPGPRSARGPACVTEKSASAVIPAPFRLRERVRLAGQRGQRDGDLGKRGAHVHRRGAAHVLLAVV